MRPRADTPTQGSAVKPAEPAGEEPKKSYDSGGTQAINYSHTHSLIQRNQHTLSLSTRKQSSRRCGNEEWIQIQFGLGADSLQLGIQSVGGRMRPIQFHPLPQIGCEALPVRNSI